MIFAIEMFIHHIAKHLKTDVHTFRMKHLAKQGDLTSTSGIFRDPIIMPQMIEKATSMSRLSSKSKRISK
jgi:CO/xanthine dehydrogenase Mo-binding subunit